MAGRPSVERRRALELLRDVRSGQRADDSFAERSQGLDTRQRAFLMELAYGAIRWRGRLEYELDRRLDRGAGGVPHDVRSILELGLYQLAFMDRVPVWSAVDESVSLTRETVARRHRSWAPGLVNAVLRTVARAGGLSPPPDDAEPARRLAIAHSHPQWLVARWLERFGSADATTLLERDNVPPAVHLAIHPSRTDATSLIARLADAGIGAEPHADKPDAIVLDRGVRPDSLPGWSEGLCWAQDVASQWVIETIGEPPPGPVLDVCAGRGTKLCALLAARGARPALAVDIDGSRLAGLEETRRRLGLGPVDRVVADARALPTAARFPIVLADVPCTGTGVLRRRVDARWRRRPEDVAFFAGFQRQLLGAVADAVAPGGTLLYATCSLEREENEEVVAAFVDGDPRFRVVPVSDTIPARHRQGPYLSARPWNGDFDGLFAARLERDAT